MARAFVALLLSDEVRAAVAAEIEHFRRLSRAVAWVPAANLHLTVKFLGEQSEAQLAQVMKALAEASAEAAPFELSLHGVGAFPGVERPRILWVGVADGALAARALHARVESALEGRGVPREARPWHPHLTIGRVFDERRWRRDATPEVREAIASASRRTFGVSSIARIALMQSHLSRGGARYSELGSVELAPRPASADPGPRSN